MRLVKETLSDYELDLPDHIAGGNVALNRLAAKKLGVRFANCLAHSRAVLLKAFLDQMTVTARVCFIRQWITAGHSTERKALLATYGFKFSALDYSQTRWQGLLEVTTYLARQLTQKRGREGRQQQRGRRRRGRARGAERLQGDRQQGRLRRHGCVWRGSRSRPADAVGLGAAARQAASSTSMPTALSRSVLEFLCEYEYQVQTILIDKVVGLLAKKGGRPACQDNYGLLVELSRRTAR